METRNDAREEGKSKKIVLYLLGILETLFTFRLVFKLLGANPTGGFVSFIYSLTGVLSSPFKDIFKSAVYEGIETNSVLEPSVIIAMAVYALIAYGVIAFIGIAVHTERKP